MSHNSSGGFIAVHRRVWLADRLPDLFRSVDSSLTVRLLAPAETCRGLSCPHPTSSQISHICFHGLMAQRLQSNAACGAGVFVPAKPLGRILD
jgi:hypothetical protein